MRIIMFTKDNQEKTKEKEKKMKTDIDGAASALRVARKSHVAPPHRMVCSRSLEAHRNTRWSRVEGGAWSRRRCAVRM